jgi:uncharacterized protein
VTEATQSTAPPARTPIRPGLFVEAPGQSPKLIGTRCGVTGQVFFPAEVMNPVTMTEGSLVRHEFEGDGRLVAWTVIGRGLPGFDSPYALATIALDAGPALIAQLHDWQGKPLHAGMRVSLTIARIKRDQDGTEIVGPKFVPIASES